ncbi:MAG: UDP-3-O-(3-hydroxymyristoyl)glucosamine N-acyltransferase, partial [Burkholderiales bacterium]
MSAHMVAESGTPAALELSPRAARPYRLADLVARFGGEALGDPTTAVQRVASLRSAVRGDVTFLSHPRFRAELDATRASAVILAPAERDATALPRIVCRNPVLYFARVARLLNPDPPAVTGVHPTAVVEEGASVAPDASVGAQCFVGSGAVIEAQVVLSPGAYVGAGARIGRQSRLAARTVVHARCVVGERTVIHSGAVIGADGFGLAKESGRWISIPQVGRVVIGDDVEVGANTTIDRGTLDDTVIEDGVKLDNQIQVAHNCRIGAQTAVAGCAGIAGSSTIGRHCVIGGAAMISDHVSICDHVTISAGTLIARAI